MSVLPPEGHARLCRRAGTRRIEQGTLDRIYYKTLVERPRAGSAPQNQQRITPLHALGAHRVFQRADALDLAAHHIAGLQKLLWFHEESDAGRRAGSNHISQMKRS